MTTGAGARRLVGAMVAAAGCLGATALGISGLAGGTATRSAHVSSHSRVAISRQFGRLPLRFEANRGQASHSVNFLARGPGYTVALGRNGALLALASGRTPGGIPGVGSSSAVVGMHLVGALAHSTVSGVSQLPGMTNYMVGADPSRWHLGIPTFSRVRYQHVYPGVDMVYHGNQNELEYDLVVAPGSDPRQVAIAYQGAQRLSIASGALLIHAPGGTILQRPPVIYQGSGSARRLIAGHYLLEDGGTHVGFQIGAYDRSQPLVIDPSISYSTFLGGYNASVGNATSTTLANGIAVDSSGDAFVVGYTDSVPPYPFPTSTGAYQTALGGLPRDAFVTKLNSAGTGVLYSTYLGGSAEDRATGVAVGPNGNAYVSGFTANGTFPTTTGAYQTTYAGGSRDAFLTELNASGTGLVYSTLLGGSGTDTATRLAVDSSGNAYLVGNSSSTNLPTTAGAFQTAAGGVSSSLTDAFVAKISPTGGGASDLTYLTYLGGSANDTGASIALDSAGEAYLTGSTNSVNEFGTFDTTAYGAFQPALKGGTNGNAYVAKLNATGTALLAATFLGGTGDPAAGGDSGAGIALDSSGNPYVTGTTASQDFPTKNAEQPNNASAPGTNADDSFVTKLAPDLKSLGYSTYNGGITYDTATDIAVDPAGNAYAVGDTLGSPPLKNPVQVRTGDYDGYLTKFDPSGNVVYSTIYGGGARDFINGVAADSAGNAYIAGRSDFFSPNSFPIKNAFQPLNGGFANAFAAKISSTPTAVLVNSLRSRGGPVDGGTTVVLTGTGFTGATGVSFGSAPAASFTVSSDSQITAVSPPHAAGQVNVTVTAPGGTSPANPVTLYEYAEGLWSLTGSLNTVHYDLQTTLLNDGRVLLVGGQNSMFGNTIPSTEIYSPLTGTWAQTGALNTARSAYTLTRLDGPACRTASPASYCGEVLVAGGSPNNAGNGSTALNSAEIYSPSAGAWSPTGNLNTAREQAASTLLDGPECHTASPPAYCGEVLVAGGFDPATTTTYNTAELYNPASGTWSPTGSFQHTARLFQSVLLSNGKVLIAGGTGSDPTATEIYNPATGTWSTTGSMNIGRQRNSLIVLQDGRVLAASGTPQGDPPQLGTPQQAGDSAEIYDPSTGVWTLVPNRLFGATRDNHDTAVLPSGEVLLADGGRGGLTSELFNPASNTFTSAGLLNISRGSGNPQSGSFDAVVLSSNPNSFAADSAVCGSNCGKVLVAGNTDSATAELYTPAPRVDAFTPAAGPETGGTSVSITGLGFTHNVRSVLFGSTPATSFTANSYGQITAVTPAGSGSVNITVVNDGGDATSAGTFAYQAGGVATPPAITVTTQPASDVTVSSAALHGLIGTGGTATTWQFQYGKTTSYGSGTPVQTIPAGKGAVSVTTTVAHLSPLVTYHFRLVGLTGSGASVKSVYGRDLTFTTKATGRLLLNHTKLIVRHGVVSASFTCSSSVSCTSKLSITTRARLSKARKLATVVCATTKPFFKVRAHKRLTVRANVRSACMTLLGKARHHSVSAKLTANPRTGQHAVIKKVVLVRK